MSWTIPHVSFKKRIFSVHQISAVLDDKIYDGPEPQVPSLHPMNANIVFLPAKQFKKH